MSYYVEPFSKPVRFNDSQHIEHNESQLLEFFRYERNNSPMGEIMREYLKTEVFND